MLYKTFNKPIYFFKERSCSRGLLVINYKNDPLTHKTLIFLVMVLSIFHIFDYIRHI